MEMRRLQKTGGSSFTLTLPKRWIDKHGLKEKDCVYISTKRAGSLVILSQDKKRRQSRVTHSIQDLKEYELRRELIGIYILGSEYVELIGAGITKEIRKQIRKTLQMLIGFEIIEESAEKIVLKNILSPEKFSFEESLENMFSMTTTLIQEAADALIQSDIESARDIVARDVDIDRMHHLMSRQYNALLRDMITEEEIGVTSSRAHFYEHTATQLERMADHACKIAGVALRKKRSHSPKFFGDIKKTTRDIVVLLGRVSELIKSTDRREAHAVLDLVYRYSQDTAELRISLGRIKFPEGYIVVDSLERFLGYIQNIAEVTIDKSIERGR